ncbi:MAG: hypothetical protein Q7R95_11285 [bacterium]|nr:hypothetical protein [bacterium]
MITYINKKSLNRYPEHGVDSSFTTWSNGKHEYFIKLGAPDCSKGWKKFKEKDWIKEEIPNLVKPFTDEQFKEYANKYGLFCAQEFLDTCNYMKARVAYQIFNPPKNKDIWDNPENQLWFQTTFKADLFKFMDGYMIGLGNTYGLDMIKFERHLAYEFKYPINEDGSMSEFMTKTFGQETTDKFRQLFLKT